MRAGRQGVEEGGGKETAAEEGAVLRFPVRRTREKQADRERKLSEIITEMALRLLKKPGALPSMAASETALLLASAAWNFASGEPGLRNQHRVMLKKFDSGGASPWAELLSGNTDQLIGELVEYKQAHYPNDRRRIVAAGMNPAGNVQVHWVEEDTFVAAPFSSRMSNATAAGAESGGPIAEKLVASMKREAGGKVVNFKDVITGRAAAEELPRTVVTKESLAGFHPAHAACVYAQNHVSVMSE
jgi:hypothetical protein